jgi:hypothetical protein
MFGLRGAFSARCEGPDISQDFLEIKPPARAEPAKGAKGDYGNLFATALAKPGCGTTHPASMSAIGPGEMINREHSQTLLKYMAVIKRARSLLNESIALSSHVPSVY